MRKKHLEFVQQVDERIVLQKILSEADIVKNHLTNKPKVKIEKESATAQKLSMQSCVTQVKNLVRGLRFR